MVFPLGKGHFPVQHSLYSTSLLHLLVLGPGGGDSKAIAKRHNVMERKLEDRKRTGGARPSIKMVVTKRVLSPRCAPLKK